MAGIVIPEMPTISDQAICIRQWDFSETSQTVSLFGRETGIFRGLAKGSRRPRSNFSGGIDLLTQGNVVAIMKPGRELATLTEWGLSLVWWGIRRDVVANRIAYYISDCITRMLHQHDPHPRVYDGFVTALEALEGSVPPEQVLVCFQWLTSALDKCAATQLASERADLVIQQRLQLPSSPIRF